MTERGAPWSAQEIEAIVADYFDMLESEIAGGAVVKAEHNRFSRTPAAFRLKPPLTDHVRLAASQYRATF